MSGESHKMEITDNYEAMQRQSQASTSQNDVRLDIEDMNLLTALRQKMKIIQEEKTKPEVSPNEENRTKIQRAPKSMLQNLNEECFQQAELSVGFIQNSNEEFFKPKELSIGFIHAAYRHRELKLQLAAHFILESGSKEEVILKEFKSKMKDIKARFDEKIVKLYIKDKQLIRLLFLDGCAMLGFIHCYVNQRLNEVGISDDQAAVIERDFLLLENQIPFEVLEVLMGFETDDGKKNHKESFLKFIFLIGNTTFPTNSPELLYTYLDRYCFSPEANKNQKPVHVLDLFREALLFDAYSFYPVQYMLTLVRGIFWVLCSCGFLATCYFLERCKKESYHTLSWRRAKQFFHSTQELKAAGINFKPSHSLAAISFHSQFFVAPQLMLPTLILDDSTAYKLLNLVAYEMCLSESHPKRKPWVTSFVNLLDSLVDNEQDIKNLRIADILRNTLSTDTLAAELINNLGAGCFAPTEDAYMGVKDNIENYYRTTCAIWMAQFCDAHFSSPWSVLALFAAIAVLVLTTIQTWYAINPKK